MITKAFGKTKKLKIKKIAANKNYIPVFEKEKYLNTEIKLKNKNEIQLSKLTNTSKWTVENYDL